MKKMNNTLLFSVKEQNLETRKHRKLLAKEEEEVEVQRDVQKLIGKVLIIVLEMQVKVLLL